MWECDGYRKLEVRNPWDTSRTLHSYLLVDRDAPPKELPSGTILRTPLQKCAVFSTVHCALINELGAVESIAGVCDMDYITLPAVKARCANGQIADLGNSMGVDKELLMDITPDALLASPLESNGGFGEIEPLGIPIVECVDHMENDALGRSEWMRLFGMLFGKEAEADSIFHEVERTFKQVRTEVERECASHRPTLLYGFKYGSAWHIAGGESYMGRLFKTAGADYLFAGTQHTGALPFAFETVFDKGFNADIWVFLYNKNEDLTYRSLTDYADFKSYKTRRIYACNTAKTPYYDEIPFHPERLLLDLAHLLYPKEEDDYKLLYFKNLKE